MAEMSYFRIMVLGLARIAGLLVGVFIIAGRSDYWQGWVFSVINLVGFLVLAVLFSDKAELIRERVRPGPGTKWWDKLFFVFYIPAYLAIIIVAGLDGGRYEWTRRMNIIVYVLSCVVYVAGYSIMFWAMWVNRFFSSTVRIQTERGHTVVQDGPYKYVRHPGYVGGILVVLSTPLTLGSFWGLIPSAFVVLLLVVRTYLEDVTLQKELNGYCEYAAKVRYRLLPRVW